MIANVIVQELKQYKCLVLEQRAEQEQIIRELQRELRDRTECCLNLKLGKSVTRNLANQQLLPNALPGTSSRHPVAFQPDTFSEQEEEGFRLDT